MNRDERLEMQRQAWPRMREMARQGNPLATLCLHCYGRHAPPNDELCPNDPPKSITAFKAGE